MPQYMVRCKYCRLMEEVYRPSHKQMGNALSSWVCRRCGAAEYEKVPQVTNWMFGDKLKGKN